MATNLLKITQLYVAELSLDASIWDPKSGSSRHTVSGTPLVRPCQGPQNTWHVKTWEDFLSWAAGQGPSPGGLTGVYLFTERQMLFLSVGWFDRKGEKATHSGYLCLPEEWELTRILLMKEIFLKSWLWFLSFIKNQIKTGNSAFRLFFLNLDILWPSECQWESILQK